MGMIRTIFIIFALLLASACSTQPHVVKDTDISGLGPENVYVVRQGLHTGFVIPAAKIESLLPQLKDRFGNSPYLEFGWGDRDYYQNEEVTSGMTLKAVFWPTPTVVRVIAIPERPDNYITDDELEILCLDKDQYALLLAFIESSFYKDENGKIVKTKLGYKVDSQFYKAIGTYYLTNTCNHWTARGLKSVEMNISPAFKLTPASIMRFMARYNKTQTMRLCGS